MAFVDLNGFESGIQFQDEPVEIIQGNVEFRVAMVTAGMLVDGLLRRLQADGLAHPQNMIGYHLCHAFRCRHHVRGALRLLGKNEIQ